MNNQSQTFLQVKEIMTPQEEILQILFNEDKTKAWLADKLGIKKQSLQYQLTNSSNYPVELHNRIMNIFQKEGFITIKSEQCNFLVRQTLEINSLIGHSVSILNQTVKNFTKDNLLDFRERKDLGELIEKIRTETNNQLDEIEKIIEGKHV